MFKLLLLVAPIAGLSFFANNSFAQKKEEAKAGAKPAVQSAPSTLTTKRVAGSNVMRISYSSPTWNTDSKKIDTALVVMRDKDSGKLVQIQLEETEPDSGQFSGQFSVRIVDSEKFQPEVYVTPDSLRGKDKDNQKLYEMIQTGKLARKPSIWKRNEKGQAVLDVYDTREQAESALKLYQEEQKVAQELKAKKKNMSGDSALAAAQAAERKAALDKLALDAAKRTQDRAQMEAAERQKAEARAAEAKKMTEEQRAANRAKAVKYSEEALELYSKADYTGAEAKFKQAIDLDSENKSYNYMYGVTLYRNQKFNEALVTLKVAKVEPKLEIEKRYYMGLVYYRLAELDNSLNAFTEVAKSKDPTMGPSALFYEGIILFTQEKYEPAKKAFETVVDTSTDPSLDNQAESYIERIAAAMAYQKLRETRFTFTGVVGLMYDSNVLLSPADNQGTGTPTNSPDARLMTMGDLLYRAIYNEKRQFTPHATLNLTNSAKSESASADPWLFDLAAPYTYLGKVGQKTPWSITVTPGYELLYMDPNKTGTKGLELSSYSLGVDNTFVMDQEWSQTYSVQYRSDKSHDPSSVGPSDMDAAMYTFRMIHTLSFDKAHKQMWIPMFAYIRDAAKGDQKTYNRYDLGVTYVRPIKSASFNAGLAYYNMTYPGTSPKQTDNDYTLSSGFTLPVREWVTWGVNASYTKNDSTVVSSAYNKYLIMTTATFVTNF